MKTVYEILQDFRHRHPGSVTWWRCKKHCKIIEKHLNKGECVSFAFAGQKNDNPFDIFNTYVCVLTNKRLLMARKRLLFGYFLISVTPDLFNDLKVASGIFWGTVTIDTVKELIYFSNVTKSGLDEIETNITEFMMTEKQKYATPNHNNACKV